MALRVRFIGSGDAFGSGGRFQTCIALEHGAGCLLFDCGASSLVAMKRLQVDPASIDAVVVSHLHGDHFGGIPFLVLEQQFAHRRRPLLVAGPPGTRQRLVQAMEALFPDSSSAARHFELRVIELPERVETEIAGFQISAFRVLHASGAPAYALRASRDSCSVAYSGDTRWTEALIEAATGADVFICESYFLEKPIKYHLSYDDVRRWRQRFGCRRLILTHPSEDLLGRQDELREELAYDGLTIQL
jgi:ribonuclease BN (tRNA processing enzyme)